MKILFLLKFPLFGGGSGSYTRHLAEHIAQDKRYEVAIAAPDERKVPGVKTYVLKPPFRAVFEGHPEWKDAKQYSRLSVPEFTRLYADYLKQIVAIVEEFKPDVIHVNHASYFTWIAAYIKSFYGITFVTTVHGTGIYLATIDRRFRALTSQALDRAESIIAVAPHTRKWLLKAFGGRLARKTRIIPGGIDVRNYGKDVSTVEIDRKYNLKDKKVILFVGRLTKEKGIEYLIKAAKHIKGEIVIIGGGPYKHFFEEYAKMLEAKNVRFLGYLGKESAHELRKWYVRADVLAVPSVVDESLGLVILEAMASRTPVVASRKGGIPLVVKDGKNGMLVRARSAVALQKAINEILNNPDMAVKLSDEARRTIMERFDWSVIVPQMKHLYNHAYEGTKRFRDNLLAKQNDKFRKEDIERERRELKKRIGFTSQL